jgi:hypothetical protein
VRADARGRQARADARTVQALIDESGAPPSTN